MVVGRDVVVNAKAKFRTHAARSIAEDSVPAFKQSNDPCFCRLARVAGAGTRSWSEHQLGRSMGHNPDLRLD